MYVCTHIHIHISIIISMYIPMQGGMATHSSILAWRIPRDRGAWQVIVHGVGKESDMTERL